MSRLDAPLSSASSTTFSPEVLFRFWVAFVLVLVGAFGFLRFVDLCLCLAGSWLTKQPLTPRLETVVPERVVNPSFKVKLIIIEK